MDRVLELANYLNKPEFKKFNKAWIDKYKKLGHLGGTIKLNHLTVDEQEALGLFLGKDLSSGSLSLTYLQFKKILATTKFDNVDFIEVLRRLQPKLMTNAELKLQKDNEIKQFKEEVLASVEDDLWLRFYFLNDPSYRKFLSCKEELIKIANCLEHLPIYHNTQESLPVFSQKHTGNPHYFDSGLYRDTLLKGICFKRTIPPIFNNAKEISDIFLEAGIVKDTLSNYCVIFHIKGSNEIYQSFYYQYEPWNLNYNNILMMNNQFSKQTIYIIENPSVFSYLCDVVKEYQLDVGLVLSNGQINLCTYELLDQLYQKNCTLYYAGDFDPEGMLIADKLKQRYSELRLWGYNESNLLKIQTKALISERRLEMMKGLKDETLFKMGEMITQTNHVGYQEGLLEVYREMLLK